MPFQDAVDPATGLGGQVHDGVAVVGPRRRGEGLDDGPGGRATTGERLGHRCDCLVLADPQRVVHQCLGYREAGRTAHPETMTLPELDPVLPHPEVSSHPAPGEPDRDQGGVTSGDPVKPERSLTTCDGAVATPQQPRPERGFPGWFDGADDALPEAMPTVPAEPTDDVVAETAGGDLGDGEHSGLLGGELHERAGKWRDPHAYTLGALSGLRSSTTKAVDR